MSDSLKCSCGRHLFTREEQDFHMCGKCLDREVDRANRRAEWDYFHPDDAMPLSERET